MSNLSRPMIINSIITSGCVSPWTIQLNVASCPSPEYTIGMSTTISGGSKGWDTNKIQIENFPFQMLNEIVWEYVMRCEGNLIIIILNVTLSWVEFE